MKLHRAATRKFKFATFPKIQFPIKTTELFKPKSTSTSCIRKNWLQEHGLRKIGHFRPYPHSLFGHF